MTDKTDEELHADDLRAYAHPADYGEAWVDLSPGQEAAYADRNDRLYVQWDGTPAERWRVIWVEDPGEVCVLVRGQVKLPGLEDIAALHDEDHADLWGPEDVEFVAASDYFVRVPLARSERRLAEWMFEQFEKEGYW